MNHHIPALPTIQSQFNAAASPNPHVHAFKKRRISNMTDEAPPGPGPPAFARCNGHADVATDEDPRVVTFRNLFTRADSLLADYLRHPPSVSSAATPRSQSSQPPAKSAPAAKPTRTIDEDDYGDEDEEDDEKPATLESSALQRSLSANGFALSRPSTPSTVALSKPPLVKRPSAASEPLSTSDDARKRLQQDKQAAEDAAKSYFHSFFHTLEFDRAAMLEQQKVDELDRQVEAEVSGDSRAKSVGLLANGIQQGTLSSANLGASSLTLKHLLARIDQNRSMVRAQDWQLRKLISEVRKNRSKWASEDKMGQEELYEAAEKVLQELKAMTEYSGPFLNRVNKREAPDYYSIIKHPMDIGTMMKKLKNFQYKSKKDFCDDLHLIWSNCLRYNTDPNHFLRKKALYMQKQTDSLTFLIPDITVRDRAEVEAEERRMQHLDAELDGIEDSDDEPIMASRGRAGPGKVAKKGTSSARKAPQSLNDGPLIPDAKPLALSASSSNLRNNFLRADSDAPMEGIVNGISTPPAGTLTPIGINGIAHSGASQADASDADGGGFTATDLIQADEAELADIEFRTWKQVTKKARATAAAERSRMFTNNRLNPDAMPLLRSKAGMRRFVRLEKKYFQQGANSKYATESKADAPDVPGETLAEGVEAAEDDSMLPDYYDPVCFIPDLNEQLQWEEDEEGLVINHAVDCFRMIPPGHFTAPESSLSKKMGENTRQMQETRKLCSKIGVVKQMQIQMQAFPIQIAKYEPVRLLEADVPSHIVTDDGPVMAPEACRAAFQRSIGTIFYHAGFEDFHASALETCTDIMSDYFQRLVKTFAGYFFSPKAVSTPPAQNGQGTAFNSRYTVEEALLHTLHENSIDLESLELYVTDDMERFGHKLGVMHDRMKAHLADLLRPALDHATNTDSAQLFHDGSQQFVDGDFAEDIGEDFFGFRELGLDREFSMATLSVPFHLLQNRMRSALDSSHTNVASLIGDVMTEPDTYDPVTVETIQKEIGLVHDYFLAKIGPNTDRALVEDDDLPPKQRFPKPRLPPTGKITSPRKRPIREQQMLAKKRRRLEEEGREEMLVNGVGGGGGRGAAAAASVFAKPLSNVKLESSQAARSGSDMEKDDDVPGILSPPNST